MDRHEILARVGDMRQVAGIDLVQVIDGPGRGVREARVWTGGGLEFLVHIDRGFDIEPATLNGTNLTWQSPMGLVHPHAFQDSVHGWARRFPGGLLTTCGLDNVGPESEERPVHGRLSNTPAHLVSAETRWMNGRYVLELVGEVREVELFGGDLVLTRTIRTEYGATAITVHDRIENRGHRESPLLLLYHCNFGYPLLDKGDTLAVKSRVTPRDDEAARGMATRRTINAPQAGYREEVFHHDVETDETGLATVGFVNPRLHLAAYLRYEKANLPHLTEWRQLGEGEYVLGLEPGTCFVLGFEEENRLGRVRQLQPGETVHTELEIGFLATLDAIRETLGGA
ncbi:MAG TPA: DUF4432 family protein [Actinobacteria bacterium]|nr:DUF4432 family protein [Actinomycetota bacterium]